MFAPDGFDFCGEADGPAIVLDGSVSLSGSLGLL